MPLASEHVPEISRRILVVEDDRVARIDLAAKLGRLGYAVAGQAATGGEALQMAGDLGPDLVIMDMVLGNGSGDGARDGIDAAARIGQTYDIPVVFLTAHSDDETLARAALTGPFGYLVKPPSDADLRTAVELALYKHGMEAELKRARDEAEEANALKASFLATMSHELRTPMNGILGMVDLLRRPELGPEHQEHADLLKKSALQLMGVLNHILEYSKLEAKRFELSQEDFRMADLLDGVVERHQDLAEECGCELETAVDPRLPGKFHGDSHNLGRVLDRLVDNAVRHGGPGRVLVQAEPGDCEDPFRITVRFTVLDSGQGIPKEKLERIFDSFIQVESYMNRSRGGLGLGLAMCRKLVRALDGRVWAETGPEGGSRFSVMVPLVPRDAPKPREAAPLEEGALDGIRVLVADDDLVSRMYVVRSLEKNGAQALAAADGDQALAILGRSGVDAVLMDLEMPGVNGLRITEQVRVGEAGCPADLPIIALTAHALWCDEQRCLEAGMNDYLAKPVDAGTMLATLGRHLPVRSGESP